MNLRRPALGLWAVLLFACGPEHDPLAEAEAAYAANRPAEAVRLYRQALERTPPAQQPAVRARLGLAQGKAGDAAAAVATLETVIAGPGTPPTVEARARRYLGAIHAKANRLDAAQAQYEAAATLFEAHGVAADLIRVQIGLAGLHWRRGDLDATHLAYLDAHGRAVVAEDRRSQGNALQGMAMVLSYAGDHAAARLLVGQACDLLDRATQADAALACRVQAAVMRVGAGEAERAATEAATLLAQADHDRAAQTAAQAAVVHAWALARLARWPAAAEAARDARRRGDASGQPRLAAEARLIGLLAQAGAGQWAGFEAEAAAVEALLPDGPGRVLLERARADHAEHQGRPAAPHLQRAVDALEALRGSADAGLQTAFLLPQRARIYERLIAHRVAEGATDAALHLVAHMKARAFTDRLRGGARPPAQGLPSPDRVTQALARHRLGLRATPPPKPATIRAGLPSDLAVVEYAVLPDRVLAFLQSPQGASVVEKRLSRAELRARSAAFVRTLRAGGAWRVEAAWLGAHLLDPLLPALDRLRAQGVKRLVVVPHGALHALPFEVLPWGDALLVDRMPVFSVPSAGALIALLQAPPPAPARSVLTVADPQDNLQGARVEAERVARFFGTTHRLVGHEAGVAAVRAALPRADVVHFAVHGVRPSGDAPAYLELRDGALRAHEVATAQLDAPLVVLSVCDSARGTPNTGDEIVGVLDRAFLEAGARAVVASRWPVHDAASVVFMDQLHGALSKGAPLIDAFHQAQLALRTKQVGPADLQPELVALLDGSRVRGVRPYQPQAAITAFDHPYFWAAFSLRGDPR